MPVFLDNKDKHNPYLSKATIDKDFDYGKSVYEKGTIGNNFVTSYGNPCLTSRGDRDLFDLKKVKYLKLLPII